MTSVSPLGDTRILDLTQIVAGPSAAMMLGDMGADVIKVEQPTGDLSRSMTKDGISSPFLAYNRNKRSIGLNLRSAEGKEVMGLLIASADVMLDGYRPGVLDRLGFDWPRLVRLNPRLVRVSISGYGATGPHGDRPGVDAVLQGEGGLMSVTGPEEGPPTRIGFPVIDAATGFLLVQAVFAGLRVRDRTGEPQHLSTSLIDVAAFLQAPTFVRASLCGEEPGRQGQSAGTFGYPSDMFRTADQRYVQLAAYFPDQWTKLLELLGLTHLASDPRFSDNSGRMANKDALHALLQEAIGTMSSDVICQRFRDAGLLGGPVLDIADVLDHPQLEHNRTFLDFDIGGETYKTPRLPLNISGCAPQPQSSPPELGQHARELLMELGYSDAHIQKLVSAGSVIDNTDDLAPGNR